VAETVKKHFYLGIKRALHWKVECIKYGAVVLEMFRVSLLALKIGLEF